MKRKIAGTLVAIGMIAVGAAACEGASVADEVAESATATASETQAAPPPAAAVAAAPADTAEVAASGFAPPFPGATIVDEASAEAPEAGAGRMVSFKTRETPDAVVDFYKSRAEAAGLAPVMAMSQGDTRAYGAAKGGEDGPSVSVVASPEGGSTSVQLTWSEGR